MSQPFAHDELVIKQHLIGQARTFYQEMKKNESGSLDKELAAALLFMNVADYLAEYVVTGLTEMTKIAVNKYYLGIVTVTPKQRDSFNIGNSIHVLDGYDFPQKTELMKELKEINTARKKIAHEMLKTRSDKLQEIDYSVHSLVDHTEKLIIIVDDITPGMPPANLIDKFSENSKEIEADKP
ncbi:hypothetical protein HGB24_00275 [Candidatus Saccharibacteria bacterium]|nr:hypothetical protein [Candidatus Saccharibacteria bacterium]